MNYKGPARNCNLHITAAMTAIFFMGNTFSCRIYLTNDLGVPFLDKEIWLIDNAPVPPIYAPGTYDFPFTVADTLGLTVVLVVRARWQAESGFVGNTSTVGSFVLT